MTLNRRNFIASGTALVLLPAPLVAKTQNNIKLVCAHTNRTCNLNFQNRASQRDLQKFNSVARDWRENQVVKMDSELLEILSEMNQILRTDSPFLLLSGYRSPQTNMKLNGTAKKSLHMKAKALDIRKPGTSLRKLKDAARKVRGGGVGYYPEKYNNFIHVDTGNVRYW